MSSLKSFDDYLIHVLQELDVIEVHGPESALGGFLMPAHIVKLKPGYIAALCRWFGARIQWGRLYAYGIEVRELLDVYGGKA